MSRISTSKFLLAQMQGWMNIHAVPCCKVSVNKVVCSQILHAHCNIQAHPYQQWFRDPLYTQRTHTQIKWECTIQPDKLYTIKDPPSKVSSPPFLTKLLQRCFSLPPNYATLHESYGKKHQEAAALCEEELINEGRHHLLLLHYSKCTSVDARHPGASLSEQ